MSDDIHIRYVGFEAKRAVRAYTFEVQEADSKPRAFLIDIANEAFLTHMAKFQDGPGICFQKLHHELTINSN